MTIKTLIRKLSKCENHNAQIHIVCGSASPGASDDDIFDTTKFVVFSDHSDDWYQDLFILDKHVGLNKDDCKQGLYTRHQVEKMCSASYARGLHIQHRVESKRKGRIPLMVFTKWCKLLIDTVK
jgi:hypothetical protein